MPPRSIVASALCAWFAAAPSAAQSPLRAFGSTMPPFTVSKVADVDGDGAPDLLQNASVALNDGTGTRFVLAPPNRFGAAFSAVAASGRFVDLNADGLPDYVDTAQVMLQSPAPVGFTVAQTLAAPGFFPWGTVEAGDLDGDGDPDLVMPTAVFAATAFVVGPVLTWFNNGLGAFTLAPPGPVPGTGIPTAQFLRDFDGDGDLDAMLFTSDTGGATLLLNSGGVFSLAPSQPPAPFNAPVESPIVGDFDGDGLPDLAAALSSPTPPHTVFVALNGAAAPGSFAVATPTSVPGYAAGSTPLTTLTQPHISKIAAADLDGDGADELLVNNVPFGLEVRPVGAGGAVGVPTRFYPDAFLAPIDDGLHDLDGDGDLDAAAAGAVWYGSRQLAMNDGVGGFAFVGDSESGPVAFHVPTIGDFDADGDLDATTFLAPGSTFGAPPGTMAVATAFGGFGGRLTPGPFYVGFPSVRPFSFDPDADGDADLYGFSSSTTPPPIGDVLVVSAGGTFTVTPLPWSTWPTSSAVAFDADADGDVDLCVGRQPSGGAYPPPTTTSLLLRNVGGTLTAPVAVGASQWTYDLAAGDFDGDGSADLLQVNSATFFVNPTIVYFGVGGPAPVAAPQASVTPGYAACADLDGDGDTDAAIGGTLYHAVGGFLTPVATLPQPLGAPGVFADMNGDGVLDLVDGHGAVTLRTAAGFTLWYPSPVTPWVVLNPSPRLPPVLSDVDLDGDLDFYGAGPRLVTNVTRQLAHANEVRIGYPTGIDVYGSPGSVALLFAAPSPANFVAAPGLTVLIDPATAQFVAPVALGGAASPTPGFASLPIAVPNVPALVGLSLHWQAIETTQGRLTNRLTSTVLSY